MSAAVRGRFPWAELSLILLSRDIHMEFQKMDPRALAHTRAFPVELPLREKTDHGEYELRAGVQNAVFFPKKGRAIDDRVSLDIVADMPGTPYDACVYRTAFYVKPNYMFDAKGEMLLDAQKMPIIQKNAKGETIWTNFIVKAMSLLRCMGEQDDSPQFETIEEFVKRINDKTKVDRGPSGHLRSELMMLTLKVWQRPQELDSNTGKVIIPSHQLYQLGYVKKIQPWMKQAAVAVVPLPLRDEEQLNPVVEEAANGNRRLIT